MSALPDMGVLTGVVMVLAGAVCLGSAVAARRWLGIVAAAVMLLAMVDLAFLRLAPALVWAALLLLAGLALGVGLRTGAGRTGGAAAPDRVGRGVAIAAAVAYPVMAWLVLAHGSGGPAGETSGRAGAATGAVTDAGALAGHVGHGSTAWLLALAVAAILTVVLVALAVAALRPGRRLPGAGATGIEAIGMAAMLGAMLLPH